ncbi:hypothetical protein H1C71_035463, partial [Ictidomys tridecemlineatus]
SAAGLARHRNRGPHYPATTSGRVESADYPEVPPFSEAVFASHRRRNPRGSPEPERGAHYSACGHPRPPTPSRFFPAVHLCHVQRRLEPSFSAPAPQVPRGGGLCSASGSYPRLLSPPQTRPGLCLLHANPSEGRYYRPALPKWFPFV